MNISMKALRLRGHRPHVVLSQSSSFESRLISANITDAHSDEHRAKNHCKVTSTT